MLDYEKPIILITPEHRADILNRALIGIGLDDLMGYISELDKVETSGLKIEILNQISVDELSGDLSTYKILDVRSYAEFNLLHIPTALNIHAGYLEKNLNNISQDEKLLVYCTSGDRSAIAAGYILKSGYKNV